MFELFHKEQISSDSFLEFVRELQKNERLFRETPLISCSKITLDIQLFRLTNCLFQRSEICVLNKGLSVCLHDRREFVFKFCMQLHQPIRMLSASAESLLLVSTQSSLVGSLSQF